MLGNEKGESFRIVLRTLDELGYDVEWQCFNAKDFGYPVIRERVFIVGHKREGRSSGEVFPITEGVGYNDSETHIFQYRRGYFRIFKGYSPTLTASMGTGGNNVPYIIDDNRFRKLTPKELFRLQGVKEEYIDKIINSGIPVSAQYERAGRTIFMPMVKKIVEKMTLECK